MLKLAAWLCGALLGFPGSLSCVLELYLLLNFSLFCSCFLLLFYYSGVSAKNLEGERENYFFFPTLPTTVRGEKKKICINEKHVACLASKQRMLQPSNHHIIATSHSKPWERTQTPNRNRMCCHQAVSHCSPTTFQRTFRMKKHRKLAPDSGGAYQRNDFSEPQTFASSHS